METPRNYLNSDTGFIAVTRRFCKKKSHPGIFLSLFLTIPTAHATDQPSKIIATTPPLAGVVKMLIRGSEPDCLLPPGSDPHHFQLSPRQVEKLNRSKLLVRSSKDDHGWITFEPKVSVIDLWPEQDHAWLNPQKVEQILPLLAEKLTTSMPEKSREIAAGLKQSKAEIASIQQALETALKQLKRDGVIMQHPSWRRLFEAFGIPILLILESQHHGHELGPHHLEGALTILKQHPNALLVGDIRHSNRSLEWLADHADNDHADNKRILYLDALGSCGDAWPALMQNNIDRIKTL